MLFRLKSNVSSSVQDGISLLHPVSSPEYSYTVSLYRSMGPLFEDSEKLVVAGDLGKKVRIQSASNEFTIFFPSRIPQVECNSLKPRSRQALVQRRSVCFSPLLSCFPNLRQSRGGCSDFSGCSANRNCRGQTLEEILSLNRAENPGGFGETFLSSCHLAQIQM